MIEFRHIVTQAVRPRRDGEIPSHLHFQEPISKGHLCTRLVNIDGKRTQFII